MNNDNTNLDRRFKNIDEILQIKANTNELGNLAFRDTIDYNQLTNNNHRHNVNEIDGLGDLNDVASVSKNEILKALQIATSNITNVNDYKWGHDDVLNEITNLRQTVHKLIDDVNDKLSKSTHIVEVGGDDSAWWRKWSDGWLEQGGDFTDFNNDDYVVHKLSLKKPFINDKYVLNISGGGQQTPSIIEKFSDQFTVKVFNDKNSNWYCCGWGQ